MVKKYNVGYTAGVFDMFHIGHLNLLRNAKKLCERLIVGVNSNNLVFEYKKKMPVIDEKSRKEIVEAIKYVNQADIINTLDKLDAWKLYRFNVVFIGSDWKGNARWNETENQLSKLGVEVIYLPYTRDISSTSLKDGYVDQVED